MTNPLIDSLVAVVAERPEDLPLRVHLAELLVADGRGPEAVPHLGAVLAADPANEPAAALMRRALGVPGEPAGTGGAADPVDPGSSRFSPASSDGAPSGAPASSTGGHSPVPEEDSPAPQGAGHSPVGSTPGGPVPVDGSPAGTDDSGQPASEPAPQGSREEAPVDGSRSGGFDWDSAEEQVGGPAPAFVQGGEPELNDGTDGGGDDVWDVEASTVTLADISGMQAVKDRLNMAFLAPLRNPDMRRLYGKSLKGGLMLYGPPGCGKTYIARALAGEMGASFMNITLTDILDQYIGNSEANLHSLFETARAHAPVVLFLDEIDAIGQKRSQATSSGWRGVTNQLLTEMDGIDGTNEGVFILAATNVPWDVDPALRRPGRFDRSVVVLPPDEPARHAILYHHLRSRPVEGIDLAQLARQTDGFTGADLAHLADSAVEYAMMDSMRSGSVRMVTMKDFKNALKQVRPSAGPWFSTARNIVAYGNRDGQYDDLAAYMRAKKLL